MDCYFVYTQKSDRYIIITISSVVLSPHHRNIFLLRAVFCGRIIIPWQVFTTRKFLVYTGENDGKRPSSSSFILVYVWHNSRRRCLDPLCERGASTLSLVTTTFRWLRNINRRTEERNKKEVVRSDDEASFLFCLLAEWSFEQLYTFRNEIKTIICHTSLHPPFGCVWIYIFIRKWYYILQSKKKKKCAAAAFDFSCFINRLFDLLLLANY